MEKPIIVSFSGGRSSGYMVYLLETLEKYQNREKIYVFANTGRELPETLQFIDRFMRWIEKPIHILEAEIHLNERKSSTFKLISRMSEANLDGRPFRAMAEKYGLPSVATPHCTRELKVNPINSFIRDHLGLKKGEYVDAIGYRYDELSRAKQDPDRYIFPLIENRVTKEQVMKFWQEGELKNWDLGLEDFEGNCDFCFKKSWTKLKKMADKHSSRLIFWNDLENEFWQEGHDLYRGHKLAQNLINGIDHEDKDMSCACSHNQDSEF